MKPSICFKLFSALLFFCILVSACGNASMNMAKSDLPRSTSPQVLLRDTQALVRGNNAFALDIYRRLSTQDGNLFLSPFSISLALAMTYAGAGGETESQMAETLHFDLPQPQLHPAFNALDRDLAQRGKANSDEQEPLQLNIANAVWAEQTYPFLREYLDQIAKNYGAGIHLADFIHQFEAVRQEINGWVLDQTEEKIRDLLPEGVLNPDTRMVLVNAIYFKADWLIQFDANSTIDSPFYLLDGSATSVPMMHKGMFVPYYQGDGFQAVELSYSGDTAAMDILVPDEGRFAEFEAGLSSAVLDETIARMEPAAVNVTLPKFSFESQFNLSEVLKSMGMSDAFEGEKADFSGMTAEKDLFISDVIHKAFVAVDEEGTEAAAATAVIIEAAGAPVYEITLTIDRPFFFIIRDKPSGQILFVGRVLNPAP